MAHSNVTRVQARLPGLIVSGLALYFMFVFGFDGIKSLIALQGKFPDYATSVIASAVVNAFDLPPHHLVTIWATVGAVKIAIAGFFLLAATEPPADIHDDEPVDHDALDLGLHGAIALTLLMLIPSWNGGDTEAVRTDLANLMLLAVIVGVGLFSRGHARAETRVGHLDDTEEFLATAELPLPTGKAPRA
jgi:hypothetical protein